MCGKEEEEENTQGCRRLVERCEATLPNVGHLLGDELGEKEAVV